MTDHITLDDLNTLLEELGQARIEELEHARCHQEAERNFADTKAKIIGAAYESGSIDGKSKDVRDAQEAQLLAEDDLVELARMGEDIASRNAQLAKIKRVTLEDRVSLLKAWLYAQSGIAW